MADASAALSIVIQWVCSGHRASAAGIAGRALALLYFLDPVNSSFDSLEDIASHVGCTKQLLSKDLMSLRRQTGLAISGGKSLAARDNYSRAQHAAVAAGTHSKFIRKDSQRKAEVADVRLDACGE